MTYPEAMKPRLRATSTTPKPEHSDRPRNGRVGPWKSVEVQVLVHDRESVSLGRLHKVTVQVVDFYP